MSECEQEYRVTITHTSEKVDDNVCNSLDSLSDSELTEEWLSSLRRASLRRADWHEN